MKIVCICDYFIQSDLMSQFKKLEKYGAEVVIADHPELIKNKDAGMKVMLQTDTNGANSVKCHPFILDICKDADIIVVHTAPVTKELIEACPKLKAVGAMRGGLNSLDMETLKERGIPVINSPTRSVHAVADFTVGMMISELKHISRAHAQMMLGNWQKDYGREARDLRELTVGVIGFGNIGKEVIKRLIPFGCDILCFDPFIPADKISLEGVTPVSRDEIIRRSDILTIHLRYAKATENYISKEDFEHMKDTCIFINTARAGLVDQDALIHALQDNKIGGAALDVYLEEPLGKDHPLCHLQNVTLTPHIAGTSTGTFSFAVEEVCRGLEFQLGPGDF